MKPIELIASCIVDTPEFDDIKVEALNMLSLVEQGKPNKISSVNVIRYTPFYIVKVVTIKINKDCIYVNHLHFDNDELVKIDVYTNFEGNAIPDYTDEMS